MPKIARVKQKRFPHEDNEIKPVFQLRRIMQEKFFKDFDVHYDLPEGLNHTHIKTLIFIRFFKPDNLTELSRHLQLEKGSFTPVAAKLIKNGYAEKTRASQDKRAYNLRLTEKGRELVEHYATEHGQYIHHRLSALSTEEQTEYFDHVRRLIELSEKF